MRFSSLTAYYILSHPNSGKIHDEIATLKATDADCGNPYGQICDFEIANGLNDFPFAINNQVCTQITIKYASSRLIESYNGLAFPIQGVLRNTKPLNYSAAKSYILTVVAIDCGMRRSKSALVTVNVKETCVQGHTGLTDRCVSDSASSAHCTNFLLSYRLSYVAGDGPKLILPDVLTHVCEQVRAVYNG